MAIRPRSSAPSGDLPEVLRAFCDREYFCAIGQMKRQPFITVPPGDDPKDWRLYTGTWSRPVIEAAMRVGIWSPPDEDIFA
jgi:hypothetical protein